MSRTDLLKPIIIGLSIIITGAVLGRAFKQRNEAQDYISVTGLGTKTFTSDEISFSGSFNVQSFDIKEAYANSTTQKEQVKKFFLQKGFSSSEIVFSGVRFNKLFRTVKLEKDGEYNKTEQIFDGYSASQSVSISSKKNEELMKRIEKVAGETSELINQGVEFEPDAIKYTYSNLPGLKHSLIEEASADARERAAKIVKKARGNLGKLKTPVFDSFFFIFYNYLKISDL